MYLCPRAVNYSLAQMKRRTVCPKKLSHHLFYLESHQYETVAKDTNHLYTGQGISSSRGRHGVEVSIFHKAFFPVTCVSLNFGVSVIASPQPHFGLKFMNY